VVELSASALEELITMSATVATTSKIRCILIPLPWFPRATEMARAGLS
jgi:hypothetical protein